MEYKNKRTGAIFNSPCVISGGNWELVEEVKNDSTEIKKLKKLNKKQLAALLEEKEIEYTPEQTKDELIELLIKE
jgi:hypothetical protein